MNKPPPNHVEDDLDLPGPYDGAEAADLWFLPDEAQDDGPPLPKAPTGQLIEPEAWRAAEASLSGALAELAFDAGRLAERLRGAGAGAGQRLVLEEAAALS